jgi:hypothetical protein
MIYIAYIAYIAYRYDIYMVYIHLITVVHNGTALPRSSKSGNSRSGDENWSYPYDLGHLQKNKSVGW